jgi:hypothetical protein
MVKDIVSAAPSGVGIEWPALKKRLLVVEPLEVEKDIKTKYGVSDAVRANVYVRVSKTEWEDYEDTLVFPRVLQGQFRKQIGKIVVGRLTQGEATKGQDPPWVLAEATEDDLAVARAFLASRMTSSTSAAADDDEPDGFTDDSDEEVY